MQCEKCVCVFNYVYLLPLGWHLNALLVAAFLKTVHICLSLLRGLKTAPSHSTICGCYGSINPAAGFSISVIQLMYRWVSRKDGLKKDAPSWQRGPRLWLQMFNNNWAGVYGYKQPLIKLHISYASSSDSDHVSSTFLYLLSMENNFLWSGNWQKIDVIIFKEQRASLYFLFLPFHQCKCHRDIIAERDCSPASKEETEV